MTPKVKQLLLDRVAAEQARERAPDVPHIALATSAGAPVVRRRAPSIPRGLGPALAATG
ncbi:MAG: hypothetical protein P4L73_20710 [Caulobacteraceae bacterium]|nr:hypothetical protein [Caulobacteraceae bacterium]